MCLILESWWYIVLCNPQLESPHMPFTNLKWPPTRLQAPFAKLNLTLHVKSPNCNAHPGIILGMGSANAIRRCNVATSLIGWSHYHSEHGFSQCDVLLQYNDVSHWLSPLSFWVWAQSMRYVATCRYNVTTSLIGWAHTQNDPWHWMT